MNFIILFVLLFTGDGVINDIYLYPLVVIMMLFLILLDIKNLSKQRFLFFSIVSVIFLLDFIKLTQSDYFLSLLLLGISLLAIPSLEKLVSKVKWWDSLLAFSIVIVLLPILFLKSQSTSRAWFIFGPNVIYRIVCFCLIMFSFYFYRIKALYLISQILGFIVILFTGSRGGVLAFVTTFYVYFTSFKKLKPFTFISVSLFFTCLLLLFIYLFFPEVFDNRNFRFEAESDSVSYRLNNYSMLLYFWTDSISNFLFGTHDITKYLDIMPHNVVLEMYYFHGFVLGSLTFFGIFLYFLKAFYTNLTRFEFLVFPIVVGSLVSGTMWDNFIVVSIALNQILNLFERKVNG